MSQYSFCQASPGAEALTQSLRRLHELKSLRNAHSVERSAASQLSILSRSSPAWLRQTAALACLNGPYILFGIWLYVVDHSTRQLKLAIRCYARFRTDLILALLSRIHLAHLEEARRQLTLIDVPTTRARLQNSANQTLPSSEPARSIRARLLSGGRGSSRTRPARRSTRSTGPA